MREWQSLLQVLHVYAGCWTELTQSFLQTRLSVAACVAWSRLLSIVTDQLQGFPRSLCQYPQPSCHASQHHGIATVGAGADPGEVKRVNFHPPFFEPPSF